MERLILAGRYELKVVIVNRKGVERQLNIPKTRIKPGDTVTFTLPKEISVGQ